MFLFCSGQPEFYSDFSIPRTMYFPLKCIRIRIYRYTFMYGYVIHTQTSLMYFELKYLLSVECDKYIVLSMSPTIGYTL